ncbi:hypothetical protein [Actinomadura sp. 21ATH]
MSRFGTLNCPVSVGDLLHMPAALRAFVRAAAFPDQGTAGHGAAPRRPS